MLFDILVAVGSFTVVALCIAVLELSKINQTLSRQTKILISQAAWHGPLHEKKAAAEQGDVFAQIDMAYAYQYGKGVPQDSTEAVAWYRKAADKGNARAQSDLGLAYHDGEGVRKSYVQAAHWYLKAAEQGNQWAQEELGLMYSTGRGVRKNYLESFFWLDLASKEFDERKVDPPSHTSTQIKRDEVARRLTPEEVSKLRERKALWLKKNGPKPGS
jgi:TPR repeat protein